MSRTAQGRRDEPLTSSAPVIDPPVESLVVYLHREAQRCIANIQRGAHRSNARDGRRCCRPARW